ncbi:MAG: GTP cyclohydrolase II [Actinomycetota bacterium]|nr:GTP cyclohydrolase II [Actinomycetota bacterium]
MALDQGGLVEQTATRWTTREGVSLEVALHAHEGSRMIVLRHGEVTSGDRPLVRLHSACLTSEALGSTRCDCRDQLDEAIRRIGADGKGLVVYFLDHEGRGIGIEAKLAAYALQDGGKDTVEANLALGLPVDDRDFSGAVEVLRSFGLGRVRLMTNNPIKVQALEQGGIEVERESAWVAAPDHAAGYLRQKVHAMSHLR